MCRAPGERGCVRGRRCTPKATAREAALRRRRENRAIGQQIQRWAKDEGKAEELAELKRQRKPINEIKAWAEQAGAPSDVHAKAAAPAKRGWEAAKTGLRNEGGSTPQARPGEGRNVGASEAGGNAPGRAARTHTAGPAPVPQAEKKPPRGAQWQEWSQQCGEEEADRVALLVQRQGGTHEERQLLNMDQAREGARVGQAGVNSVKRLVYEDGACGYFKPYDALNLGVARMYGHSGRQQPTHEAAASQFAQALGPRYAALVPPVVLVKHEGRWGSISYGVPGEPVKTYHQLKQTSDRHSDQASDMAFFDCLIGQVDRHGGNVLMDRRGLSGIDNGFAFTDGIGGVNASIFTMARSSHPKARHLTDEEDALLGRFLDSKDGLGLQGTIEEGRFHEVRRRALLMRRTRRILDLSQLYPDG